MRTTSVSGCICALAVALAVAASCKPQDPTCRVVRHDELPAASDPFDAEVMVDGLQVPWSLTFLTTPTAAALVTERAGRLRLIDFDENRALLVDEPLLTFDVTDEGEGGLLGVAHDPSTADTLFIYRTTPAGDENVIERVLLEHDGDAAGSLVTGARVDGVVVAGIPANKNHDGGRLRFGPDGALWASTGDAQEPQRSRNVDDLAGKILRIDTATAAAAVDVMVAGVRNSQGFAFLDDTARRLIVTDHGPSGEFAHGARRGECRHAGRW